MARKEMLPARLRPELIEQIRSKCKEKNTDVDSFLTLALNVLDERENEPDTLRERFDVLEKNVGALVNILESILPQIEDRAFRAWTSSRVVMAWTEAAVDVGGIPSKDRWNKIRDEKSQEFKVEREKIISKMRGPHEG